MTMVIVQVLLCLGVPALAILGAQRSRAIRAISPVVICYAVGISMANIPGLSLVPAVSENMTTVTVLLAIPLVLFSSDLIGWLREAPHALLAFGLAIFSVLLVSSLSAWFFAGAIDEVHKVAGMVVGVYTGGTPNMNAIGMAVEVRQETFVLLNAADVVLGALYLLVLMTVGPRIARRLLPPAPVTPEATADPFEPDGQPIHIPHILLGLLASLAAAGLAIGLGMLLTGGLHVTIIILGITTFGILGSRWEALRTLPLTYATGQYLLLVFCVAIGMLADIAELAQAMSAVLAFVAVVLVGSVVLHFSLCRLFRIDADTAIITTTAAVFGPPFVGPIANVLQNRAVVVTGMTAGVLGLALGNYLGIGLTWLLAP